MRDYDALTRGEAVSFEDCWISEIANVASGGIGVRYGDGMPGGNARPLHEGFREGLASFELSGGGGGSDNTHPSGAKCIDDAGDEGGFRSDHGEYCVDRPRDAEPARGGGVIVWDTSGNLRDTRVSWTSKDRANPGTLGETPSESMLATAASDDKDAHGKSLSKGSALEILTDLGDRRQETGVRMMSAATGHSKCCSRFVHEFMAKNLLWARRVQ